MEIQFFGATQTVTGSQIVLRVNGSSILLDCGLFQGRRQECYELNSEFLFNPSEIDSCIVSHAHIDHSGNLPSLTSKGFRGSIYTSAPTADLCGIMLKDSAFLQEHDLRFVNKIRARKNEPPMKPIYSMADAEECIEHFVGIDYDTTFTVAPGVNATFRDAGHILGSASTLLEITENNRTVRLGFSGDIGRPDMPIIHDPNRLRDVDALIMESTYGNRSHDSLENAADRLVEIIKKVSARGGKIIIPAFAVGRTQELIYFFHMLYNENRIPDIPVFVDSPLACKATDIFRKHPDYFDRKTGRIFLKNDEDPFFYERLKYTPDVNDSKSLNGLSYPHIIISASGMAEGGRILHHLRNNIHNPRNLILFVGYAAQNTLARRIMDGNKIVKIFGEEHTVKAEIETMNNFSAHADRRDLLDYAKTTGPQKLKNIFVIHGEPEQSVPLINGLKSIGYKNVHYPKREDKFTI